MSDESLRKAGRAELDRLNKARPGAMSQSETDKVNKAKPKRKRVVSDLRSVLPVGRDTAHNGKSVSEVVDEAVSGAKLPY